MKFVYVYLPKILVILVEVIFRSDIFSKRTWTVTTEFDKLSEGVWYSPVG